MRLKDLFQWQQVSGQSVTVHDITLTPTVPGAHRSLPPGRMCLASANGCPGETWPAGKTDSNR